MKLVSLSKGCKRLVPLLAATTGLLISQGEAKALNLKTFDLQWSPQPGSQGAINGKITLDLESISLPTAFQSTFPGWATDLSVVVSGTGGNNGTFVQSDFDSWVFDNNAISFDFSQDLVGQGGWGTSCSVVCDFNLFSGLGPNGAGFFKLASGSDAFVLSKFAPAGANTGVPAPGPMPVVGAVAAFGWSRRLRKRIATPLITQPQA
ncbi:MAG: hypothetical protein WCP63_10440 [Cyanobium sp. ELA712]